MILIIDNYDSFVYNLARYIEQLGYDYKIIRNDKITITEIKAINPKAIIISPGPGKPKDAGICIELIKELGATIPILGVCLGHQAIGEAYGGATKHASAPMHGKASLINHNEKDIFNNIKSPIKAGRYHSLITDISQSNDLTTTATSESDEIMAIKHKHHPVFGVQFHPESILTAHGIKIIDNFITYSNNINNQQSK